MLTRRQRLNKRHRGGQRVRLLLWFPSLGVRNLTNRSVGLPGLGGDQLLGSLTRLYGQN